MALIIENRKIVGEIDNLEAKLEGKIPVDKLELLYLVNSWGRKDYFNISGVNDMEIKIEKCEAKECYDLSKLDTSEITNMNYIFKYSLFNDIHSTNGIGLHDGDISNWNVSNVTSMNEMFFCAENFNQPIGNWDVSKATNMLDMFCFAKKFNSPLNNWDTSNVTNMAGMFYVATNFNQPLKFDTSNVTSMVGMFTGATNFNQNVTNWNISKVINMESMFYYAKGFKEKYNSGEPLPTNTNDIKEWLIKNREKMSDIDIKNIHGEEIDDFFNDIYSTNRNILHNNIHSLNKV